MGTTANLVKSTMGIRCSTNTANGAKASTTLYSIIETAKANGLMPFDYLNLLFTELPKRNEDDDITDLLPWKINL